MNGCKRKVHRTFRFFILLAVVFLPYSTGSYRLTDLEYGKPDSPVWNKLKSFKPYKQGPLALGLESGLISKSRPTDKMEYMLLPFYCIRAGGPSRKIKKWERSLLDSPLYRGTKDMVRHREDYVEELTRIKNTFSKEFGGYIRYMKLNLKLLIPEFIVIFILYGISLIFCLFIDRS